MHRALLIGAAFAAIVASTLLAAPKQLTVVLKWNPNAKQQAPLLETTGGVLPIVVAPIVDTREKGSQIGQNVEGKTPVPVFTTSDVSAYVREHLVGQLRRLGLDVRAGESGARVLQCELVDFWVEEGHLYQGSVSLRASLADGSGKELWSAVVAGGSDNFGRSLKPDNYTEAFSNSILELAGKLESAPGLRQAIAKTP
jgi:hypothetical protein